ncbi:HK97 gp10 family phage protein [Desulforamulus aquiferis]|uniref:HK97 gp10 family phage protein n=1 Tax=Desulforamulus aquiferis TaxID=1397668 RepID=A0AAW7ZBS6_9FIRM|nr:HK97 gp10 family phage protein [Desulforamulus aquiferis]MDO7787129.1 HK97 gp10 family phage protein [Desulforamulus aquiferis]
MARNGVEIRGLRELIRRLERATNGELRREFALWLEATGFQFLEEIQQEIIRTQTVDTRRLLNSFDKGDGDNVWSITDRGLTLEIGSNLSYASYANDGHWQERRFIPGRWNGHTFEYDSGANTGMMLKAKWIEGTGYWDSALLIFERIFERALERKLQQWLDTF